MLPFPIMNEYGNTIIKSTIKKVVSSDITLALLYSNGHLYMRGANNFNQFGITSPNSYKEWVLVRTDVKDVWCGTNHTIVQTTDDQFLCAGYYRSLGYNVSTTSWIVYDKLYALTSTPASTIRSIQAGTQGTFVLLNDSRLFAIGFNHQSYLGSLPSTITSFQLSLSNVKSINYNINCSFAITNDNKLMGIGNSDNYKLGTGSNAIQTTWVQIALPSGYTYPVQAYEGYRTSLVFAASDSTLTDTRILFCGYNGYNSGGQIPFNGTSSVTKFTVGAGGADNQFSNFGTGYINFDYQNFYTSGTKLYAAGPAGANIASSTARNTGFSEMTLPAPGVQSFCRVGQLASNSGSTFVVSNNLLYACGVSALWLDADTYVLTPIRTPE